MTGFPSALGVVRLQIAPDHYVASLPMPAQAAADLAATMARDVARAGATTTLIAFTPDPSTDQVRCWVRASAVLTVDVVPTEDPSC